jgi:hypothetical protein
MNFTEPDVDLENQYYNSKALKESDPQVGFFFTIWSLYYPLANILSFIVPCPAFFARGSGRGEEMNLGHCSVRCSVSESLGHRSC